LGQYNCERNQIGVLLLQSTKITTADIPLIVGISFLASQMSTQEYSNRFFDPRFVVGAGGLIYSQMSESESVNRPVIDFSFGLLTSFFSTEVCKNRNESRTEHLNDDINLPSAKESSGSINNNQSLFI
jgi:hypothetical protein